MSSASGRSGRQLGALWGGIVILLLAIAPFADRFAERVPACPMRSVTGIPCPGCGMTTAGLSLAHGDIGGAFAASPLAALGWIAIVAGGLIAGVAAMAGRAVPEPPTRLPAIARVAIVGTVVANWAYLLFRG